MRSIHGTSRLLLACAVALAVLLPGCKPKAKPAPPPVKAEPQIQPSQLHGRWEVSTLDGRSVDRATIESHELEFSADQARSVFINPNGAGTGGVFAWRLSGATLTLVVDPFNKITRSSRISIDGSTLVIEPSNPFPMPEEFRSRTLAYRKAPPQE
jgi:hypothetical protein